MLGNAFDSIYGKTDEGIFDDLYSRHGASPPVKRMDIRLGQTDQTPDDDDEDEEDEEQLPAQAQAASAPVSQAPSYGPVSKKPFFSQDIGGFPLWLVGVGFLGFAWAFRHQRKKQSVR